MRNAYNIQCFGWERGRDHLEDLGVDGKNIKMDLGVIEWENVDWNHLA
jgi:hypothetical protein